MIEMVIALATMGTVTGVNAVPSVLRFFFVSLDPAMRSPTIVGAVTLAAFGLIIAMTLVTTPLGVALPHKMEAVNLKWFFAIFLVFEASNMLRKAMGY